MPDELGFAAYWVMGLVALFVGALLVQFCRGIWRGLTGRTGTGTTPPAERHAERQHS